MANQIKRRNISSLTYENFPGGHPSQHCSHPCTLNSTIPPQECFPCKLPSIFGVSSFDQPTAMASSLIANALQVNFESVLIFPEEGMVAMFKALESTGLHGFLGCSSVHYEQELEQFCSTSFVRDNEVLSCFQGKLVAISEDRFVGVFELPTEGLTDVSEVPNNLIFDSRSDFSAGGEQLKTSCKKREMKFEFRLLNDILAKSVKAGSFDAVTHERFLLMTAIHFGIKVNWSQILFGILKKMAIDHPSEPRVLRLSSLGYLKLLQMGNADPNKTKAGNKYEVKPHPSQLGGRHSNPVVTTPTIALDFSGTTQQSASHNVAPNQMLAWEETDSLQTAVQRRLYIIAKYREMLLRIFLEAMHQNFESSTPTTAIDLQVLDMLSKAHRLYLIMLREQMRVHKLEWTRPYNSRLFEGANRQRVGTYNLCTYIVAVGPVVDRSGISRRIVNNVQYSIRIVDFIKMPSPDTVAAEPIVDIETDPTESLGISQRHPDAVPNFGSSSSSQSANPNSPSSSSSSDSSMHFTLDDIPSNEEITVDDIPQISPERSLQPEAQHLKEKSENHQLDFTKI
ncbi:hypothetical protein F511_25376 [Dorcoceras hygrometricum]|uniref:Dystroglycan-like n=1 Tax=Dorcoceras hygrometricum TaxID=472368 RepID=A0A2Z7A3F1_9LAMI|nr:hypothetical protein F511_25376 [Dorcoceras hygrometricum]